MNAIRPYIIAEAGSCHEGSLGHAMKLTDYAHEAGCQAIKFQYWSHPARMRERRHVSDPQAYESGSVKPDWIHFLALYAHHRELDWICSVYLPEDVSYISTVADALKISSFEALDKELVQKVSDTRKPYFVSTGMQTGSSVLRSKDVIEMHCVSAYPCPIDQANIAAVMWKEGYSDHTRWVQMGGLAVAAGADYLEVHFRLDDTPKSCPDYPVSLTPLELREYVKFSQQSYAARGSGMKIPQICEKDMMKYRVVS